VRQHIFDVDVDVDLGLVAVGSGPHPRKHLGEPLGREGARIGERVGFRVRVSGEFSRVSCGEHDGQLCGRGIARDEKAAYAEGRSGRDALGRFKERLAQIFDVLLVT